MADFSVVQARWFVVLLGCDWAARSCLSAALGADAGQRRLGFFWERLLFLTWLRADVPWIHYFNYKPEYAENSVVDFLGQTL